MKIRQGNKTLKEILFILLCILPAMIILLFNRYYLLLHSFLEIFGVLISISVFILMWNWKDQNDTSFLLLLGISFFFTGLFDFLHLLTYKGMTVMPSALDGNLSVQLWLAGRLFESLSFLVAFSLNKRRINPNSAFLIYLVLFILLLFTIFQWRIIPLCFTDGQGSTVFRISAGILIVIILIASESVLYRIRKGVERDLFRMLAAMIGLMILSEVFFMLTREFYDVYNLIGLILKFLSFVLVYEGILVTGLVKPQNLIISGISDREKKSRLNESILLSVAENFPNSYLSIIEKDLTVSFSGGSEFARLGLDPQSFNGCAVKDIFGEKSEDITSLYERTFQGEACQFEMYFNDQFQLYKTVPLYTPEGQIERILAVVENVTALKREERILEAQWRFHEYSEEHDFQELMQFLVDEAEFLTGSGVGFFHFVNEDEGMIILQTWSENTLGKMCEINRENLDRMYPIGQAGIWCDSIRERKPVIHNDYQAEPLRRGLPEGHAPVVRELVFPVIRNEKIEAILGVGNKVHPYDEKDMNTVNRLAEFAWETITRKKAEASLKERDSRLRNLEAAVEQSPVSIVVTDNRGNIEYVNRKFCNITGYSEDEVLGENPRILNSREMSESYYKNLWSTIAGGGVWKGLFHNRKKNGELYWEDAVIAPVIDKADRISHFVAVKEDITRRLEEEKDRRKLQEQLHHQGKMDAMGQMAGGMAHDFNNTLSAIIGASELLESSGEVTGERERKYVDLIKQAAVRAADLTAKLLTFSRKGRIDFDVLDIHELIDESISILRRTLDKKVSITSMLEAECSTLKGDSSALENGLMNLCINAGHAMPDGGEITIKTSNIRLEEPYCRASTFDIVPGEFCKLEIIDTGSGIPLEIQDKIFEPFFTTKERGRGTGLGLSSVYGTIQDHHGEISVYSEIGSGTSFHILLPCTGERGVEIHRDTDLKHGSGIILLIDDDEFNRVIGRDLLEDLGYEVLLAENGKKALEIFHDRKDEIDLVLTDMIMPEMNGRETFYKLREIDSQCRIILVSGFVQKEVFDELAAQGLNGFIQKPYRDFELSRLIAEVLQSNPRPSSS